MLNFIKNLFKKETETEQEEMTAESMFAEEPLPKNKGNCGDCKFKKYCTDLGHYEPLCDYTLDIEFDKNKDSILIIDDNEGMISILQDDLEYMNEEGIINKDEVNIISVSGNLAAFSFNIMQRKANGLNIKWAIIDITLGGSIMTEEGNIKYTGIDVYEMIIKYNPEVNFLFYTGNNLNPYINANKILIDQFKELSGDDIKDYVLFKTSMDMKTRREYIIKRLFTK